MITACITVLIAFGADRSIHGFLRPQVSRVGNNLRISSSSDGPFLFTTVYAKGAAYWAPLDPPIAFVESGMIEVDLGSLKWHTVKGDRVDFPRDADFQVWYFEPERTSVTLADGQAVD